jgi:hypothetical protein
MRHVDYFRHGPTHFAKSVQVAESVDPGMNGGDDETRTRDLCRDSPVSRYYNLEDTRELPNPA